MGFAVTKTRSTIGIQAKAVSVEVHIAGGLPQFHIVGLPETSVKESRDRVRSAILNSKYEFPMRRITVNLAPAELPKSGSGLDLAIAIGILAASNQISQKKIATHEFISELALDGKLRGISSIIPCVLATHQQKQTLIIAQENVPDAAMTALDHILSASSLTQVCQYLCQDTPLEPLPVLNISEYAHETIDWSEIKGQPHAKFALEIAAAGGHHVLMSGPPGSGKTMLARRFHTLLPHLSHEQALESASIRSLRGLRPDYQAWKRPAFRCPHHTASMIALVGGGNPPKPGEISLAHRGVLFLDEILEFSRQSLETLREPIETGQVCISRAAHQVDFPARFQLIAAMNPCPCGHWNNSKGHCTCSPEAVQRYLAKLSAPLLDRIDIHLHIQPLSHEELLAVTDPQTQQSLEIREKINQLQRQQWERQGCLNAHLDVKRCENIALTQPDLKNYLNKIIQTMNLSARAFHRLIKVAQTISDYEGHPCLSVSHLQKALSLRQMMRR